MSASVTRNKFPLQRIRRIVVAGALALTVAAVSAKQAPDQAKTRAYIDHAWITLTRSMDDCSA